MENKKLKKKLEEAQERLNMIPLEHYCSKLCPKLNILGSMIKECCCDEENYTALSKEDLIFLETLNPEEQVK